MKLTGGLISKNDLAAYRVRVSPPLTSRYRELDVVWSPGATGGISALQILNTLGHFPPDRVGWGTPLGLHHRAQAIRRAFLDRFAHLGDPEVIKAPWDRLASADYARAVASEIRRGRRTPDGVPGMRGGPAGARRALRKIDDCTTHVCAVDRERNMVSLTNTAVSTYGSRMVVPGTGILLNNGMIWFDPEPAKPNSVGPGKRAMVNMAPALAFKGGRPYLAVGAPGGRKIISAIPQVIASLVDSALSAQAAIEAPRVHTEGDTLEVDDRVGERVLRELGRRGYALVAREETYASSFFAKPIAIRVGPRWARGRSRPSAAGRRRWVLTERIMSDITLTAAFSTVPAGEAEEIKRVIVETVAQLARDDGTFTRAKIVFTESDERCGLTAELDGVKKEGVPLQLDLEQLEDAKTSAGARAQLKEALRMYFRKVQGR